MPASGVIFAGNAVKTLKSSININGNSVINSGSADPTSSATSGNAGDLYLSTNTGKLYIKQDSGSTTNWKATNNTSYSPSSGDIDETSFTAADNQSAAANVTGLSFANATVRAFEAIVSIVRGSTYANYQLRGIQRGSDWLMDQSYTGDSTGITFTITTAGQVQYTSTSTGSSATLKFRAFTTTV